MKKYSVIKSIVLTINIILILIVKTVPHSRPFFTNNQMSTLSATIDSSSQLQSSSKNDVNPINQEDLYQIALLIDQLKNDDIHLRVVATKNLCRISKTLGPERTRDELIPFLSESMDDEDEVLQVISEMLGELIDYLGGSQYVYLLLEPLESLVSVEEARVRKTAIESIIKVTNTLPVDHMNKYYVPFIERISKKEWFTSRTSATSLSHIGYERLSENDKVSMQTIYIKLCSDETPAVRRAAAQCMTSFISKLNQKELSKEFLSSLSSLIIDDQDSVRIQSIISCIVLSETLSTDAYSRQGLPMIIKAADDASWRIRYTVATQLYRCFAPHISDKVAIDSLTTIFVNLLNDSEAEVRAAAAATVYVVAKSLQKEFIVKKLLPLLDKLIVDGSENVRASLAHSINDISEVIGKDLTIEHLLPLLLAVLRDESSEVRLNIISKLDKLNRVIGVQLLTQSLLPAITELSQDSKWRVRNSIVEHMPMLGLHIGPEIFREKLCELCFNWLKDSVYTVRKSAAKNLEALSRTFGDEFTSSEILPYLEKLSTETSHTHRLTAVQCYQLLLPSVSLDMSSQKIIPHVLLLCSDTVPNIRFNIVTLLETYCHTPGSTSDSQINVIKALETLSDDGDKDVQWFAKKALLTVAERRK